MKQEHLQELCNEMLSDIKHGEQRLNELQILRPHIKDDNDMFVEIRLREMEQNLRFTKSIALLASALVADRGENKDK